MAVPLALRLAARELRGGLTGFRVFIAALALGVGAIAAVGSLSASVVSELQNNARAMLGGDAEVTLTARPADDAELAFFDATSAQVSVVHDLRSMARNGDGTVMLVELKGVDDVYPLFGQMTLTPSQTLDDALAMRDGVPGAVAEAELFSRLALGLGDRVFIGDIEVELRAVIGVEPDRTAGVMALGPRLMVSAATLDSTGLVRMGSLLETRYRFALDPAADPAVWLDDLNAAFPQAGWRASEYTSAQPALQTFVDRLGTFLTLVGLTALVIGGVGVGNAVRSYLAGKTATIATLKSLGATGGLVFQIYFWQVAVLAAIGIVLGLIAGALTPLVVTPLIGDALPVAPGFSLYWLPLGLAAAYGALTATAFALWPLAQAREVPAAGLFRAIVSPVRRWPRTPYVILTAGAILALIGLAIFGTGNPWLGAWFAAATLGGLVAFRLVAFGVMGGLLALPQIRRPSLRLALASLTRPGTATGSVMMSLGLGLSVLV
ncbi:MAG: FtsX-like permease family protein, partial [Alphaproteobacteria bacterium]|nr:FtsX-like permease family protein [Alphaproteobacteria bacterium]